VKMEVQEVLDLCDPRKGWSTDEEFSCLWRGSADGQAEVGGRGAGLKGSNGGHGLQLYFVLEKMDRFSRFSGGGTETRRISRECNMRRG